jgi:hypothetical protein
LAHISQTSSQSRDKASEWPQYSGPPRATDSASRASDRRVVTNPSLTLSAASELNGKLGAGVSAGTPLIAQLHPQAPSSRRGSPSSLLDGISSRSVPATPLGVPSVGASILQSGASLGEPTNGRLSDLPSLSARIPSAQFDNGANGSQPFNGSQSSLDDSMVRFKSRP